EAPEEISSTNNGAAQDIPQTIDKPIVELNVENARVYAEDILSKMDAYNILLYPSEIELKDSNSFYTVSSVFCHPIWGINPWIAAPVASDLTLDMAQQYMSTLKANPYNMGTDSICYDVFSIQEVQQSIDEYYGKGRTDISKILNSEMSNNQIISDNEYIVHERYLNNDYPYIPSLVFTEIIDCYLEGDYAVITFYIIERYFEYETYTFYEPGQFTSWYGLPDQNTTPDSFDSLLNLAGKKRNDLAKNELLLFQDDDGIHIWGCCPAGKNWTKETLEEISRKTEQPKITIEDNQRPHAFADPEVGLYLRTGPGSDYDIIALMPQYSTVTEVGYNGKEDEWVFINYRGLLGWAATKYLNYEGGFAKPVIYLYPEQEMDIEVKLTLKTGYLSCTYPTYVDRWYVHAYPDGVLINYDDGYEYSYLYWEGHGYLNCDFNEGFVVKGTDTASFLREKLSFMGLTPKEYNEFIVYWLPLMQNNPYNIITFMTNEYTDNVILDITPTPDSILRIYMTYMPLDEPIEIDEQKLTEFERKGFTVIEWGGMQY
ncbi:MAG: SH3 domain-containing protein, partial [Oscillospiraceae bacterium]|nr:SH3 domain-containing protein [Oscillospiraceae bacterium]